MNKKFISYLVLLIFITLIARAIIGEFSAAPRLISLAELSSVLENAASAQTDGEMITLALKDGSSAQIYASSEAISQVARALALKAEGANYYFYFIIALFALAFILAVFRRGSNEQGQQQQNNGAVLQPQRKIAPGEFVSFDDVLGAHVAKRELQKLTASLNASAPMRALLFAGASGVGKTMLARALASAANCAFHYASASSFNELYVGMGAKRVRELFAAAMQNRPCIIFIDEIDALGAARGNLLNKESEHTLNELLVQMDGFASRSGILLIAATNRADVLDPALLRRFSKKIEFSLPNEAEREEFVRAYQITPALELSKAIALTNGFSGADFAAVAAELSSEPDEQEVLKAIAERRFGLASTAEFSEQMAISQAGVLTVARLLGAEVYHVAGRVIWQLNLIPSKARALSEAQILLAANEATKIVFSDEYGFNQSAKNAAAAALKPYLSIDETGLKASSELAQMMEDAASAAHDLLQMHKEQMHEAARELAAEAAPFKDAQ